MLILSFQNLNAQKKSEEQDNLLVPVTISYFSRCDSYLTYQMKVYKKGNNAYYAENIRPFHYYGYKTDSIWSTKLNKQQISTLKKFLLIAKRLNENCQNSNSIPEYQIITDKDTLKITSDCDWNNLDYFSLQENLFKTKFNDLKKKRKAIIDSLDKKITGKWYYEPLKEKPKKGDCIKLTKVKQNQSDCYWEFSKNYFKSSCNNVMNFTYTKDYEWNVDGQINLNISPGLIIAKDGSMTIGNYNQEFILKFLNDNELELEFSYVN